MLGYLEAPKMAIQTHPCSIRRSVLSIPYLRGIFIPSAMKVLALNGSPRLVGNTSNALTSLLDSLEKEGFETDQIQVYEANLLPCNFCGSCELRGDGRCVMEEDQMNEYLDRMRAADIIILASPSYYGSCSGQLKIFLERAGLCLQGGGLKGKIGAAFVTQERDGGMPVYSELVNWMLRNQMIVVGSDPLSIIMGKDLNRWEEDGRGLKAMKSLAENITETFIRLNE